MLRVSSSSIVRPLRVEYRSYAIMSDATADIRSRLMSEVKLAMKNKDSVASTAIRSVLSEVYAEDKESNKIVPAPAVSWILRKNVIRRTDAAAKFMQASRPDLAEKENYEAQVLSKFLPPLLSEAVIDHMLTEITEVLPAGIDKHKSMGRVLKEFYSRVDQSTVDPNIVKKRAIEISTRLN